MSTQHNSKVYHHMHICVAIREEFISYCVISLNITNTHTEYFACSLYKIWFCPIPVLTCRLRQRWTTFLHFSVSVSLTV